tara:strand:- start:398 stop:1324 length:927 start_codon:yes stop_codon:yes gene_type:complete
MPSPYNDVELTDSDKQSIYENPGMTEDQNPREAGVDGKEGFGSQAHDTDTPEEEVETQAETQAETEAEGETEVYESDEFNLEDYEVEIDGETFDGAEILKWREDSSNKENWQASNTQKAQEIAKWSKFNNKIAEDSEFRDYVKDFFYEDESGLKELGLDKELRPLGFEEEIMAEPEKGETDMKMEEVEGRLNQMEFERHVDDLELELNAIVDDNKDLFEGEDDEIKFLEFAQESNLSDLNQAFKLWSYDKMQDELDHHRQLDGNKQRNRGKVVHNSKVGATEVSTPKSYKNMKDININDPDVAKYFNK